MRGLVQCTVPVHCAFLDRSLHSRMPLDPTQVRLKLLRACDQWHSSRESTALTVAIVNYAETLKGLRRRMRAISTDWRGSITWLPTQLLPPRLRSRRVWIKNSTRTAPSTHCQMRWSSVRCAFFGGNVHSRMPLDPTHVHLKLLYACDQWHASRVSTPLTGLHCKLRPNTEGLVQMSDIDRAVRCAFSPWVLSC
jgi:hypothetical protein